MKTIKITFLVFAAIFWGTYAYATGNLNARVSAVNEGNAVVEIKDIKKSSFAIELTDANGLEVFSKKTSEPLKEYKRLYDFSNLEEGKYTMTFKSERETIKKELEIKNDLVYVLDSKKKAKPFFTFGDDRFVMSYLNFEVEALKLYVYDDDMLNEYEVVKD